MTVVVADNGSEVTLCPGHLGVVFKSAAPPESGGVSFRRWTLNRCRQRRGRMSSPSKPTWTRVFLPLLTLGFPLGVLLMIVSRLPVEEMEMASTDTRLLSGFSTFWCGWQEVTSTHPFYAYKVPDTPKVVSNRVNINHFAFRFTLSEGRVHYLRYHMLEGSSIEASGCAGERPVHLDVVYAQSGTLEKSCWLNQGDRNPKTNSPGHRAWKSFNVVDDLSSEEEDSSSSSSSEEEGLEGLDGLDGLEHRHRRFASGESTRDSPKCDGSSFSTEIEVASEKSDQDYPTCPGRFANSFAVTRAGTYYVVTRGGGDWSGALNHVLLHVRLNRSGYELPDNVILCRSQNACEIPLTFGSSEKVVAFVSAEPDAGSVSFAIRSKCKPRLIFYVAVFLAFPLSFAFCLTLAIRRARRGALIIGDSSSTPNRDLTGVGNACSAPLLEAGACTGDNDAAEVKSQESADSFPPPSYPSLTLQQRAAGLDGEAPPPSYERAVANQQPSITRV